jgi:hypothetical protein
MDRPTASRKKTWWAPLWRGLVVDPDGKHIRVLRRSVWLLLYLILHAERITGVSRAKRSTIARSLGVSFDAREKWTTYAWQE